MNSSSWGQTPYFDMMTSDEAAALLALCSRAQFQKRSFYPERNHRRGVPKQLSKSCYPDVAYPQCSTAYVIRANGYVESDRHGSEYYKQHNKKDSQQREKRKSAKTQESVPQNIHHRSGRKRSTSHLH
jgi:hypothetical protein